MSSFWQAVAAARVGRTLTPRSWPDNARVAVCLSFDVDNESYLLAGGETSPTTLSAADFGAETGLARILEMLDRYQVPASFFIPAVSALLHPQMIPAILKSGRHEGRRARLDTRIAAGDRRRRRG